jgi:hypothetical protein
LPPIRSPYYKSYRSLGLNPNALQINDYKSTISLSEEQLDSIFQDFEQILEDDDNTPSGEQADEGGKRVPFKLAQGSLLLQDL